MLAIFFAAFQATRSLNDLLALLGIGLIGVLLRRFGWWRPAFLIGFVLASGAERYLCQAAQFDGWSFITPPVGLVILAVTLPSLWAALRAPGQDDHGAHQGKRRGCARRHSARRSCSP